MKEESVTEVKDARVMYGERYETGEAEIVICQSVRITISTDALITSEQILLLLLLLLLFYAKRQALSVNMLKDGSQS